MRRYPSIKRIQTYLRVDLEKAKRIRGLMDGSINPKTSEAVNNWIRQCYHEPSSEEQIMCAINETFETHGVEAIEGEWIDSYYCNIRAVYCNTGDTYACTVLLDHETGNYQLTSWGDFVERNRL